MNISEIRKQYPQYNDLSDEQLIKGLHRKFYSDMPYELFSEKIGLTKEENELPPSLSIDEMKDLSQRKLKDAGIDTSSTSVFNSGVDGIAKGLLVGAERLGSAGTFGLTGWVGDKLNTGSKELREEVKNINPNINYAITGVDLVGGAPVGGTLFKGVSAGSKAVPYIGKALKYAAPAATGAISGGLYSGFENDSLGAAGSGAVVGGLTAGVLDLAGRGVSKLWSSGHKIDGIKRGLDNAVESSKGTKILGRAVKESDDIAQQVYEKAPEALDSINSRAISKLDDAVKGGVDVKGEMAKAKNNYSKVINDNKNNTILPYPRKNTLSNFEAETSFNIRPESSLDISKSKLIDRANKSNIEIVGNVNHLTTKRGRGTYTRTLSNTLENPDITYSFDGKNYTLKKYDGIINGKKEPFFDFVVQKDGKLYNKFVPDDLNYISNQLKKPTQNMSLSGRVTAVEGTYPPSVSNNSLTQIYGPVNKKITAIDLIPNADLSNNQLKALNTAWEHGANSLKKGEAIGSLKHIDEMKKSLNRMIEKSKVSNPNGVGTVPTSDTVALQELKGYLKETMNKSGLSEINGQYARAKGLESAFNQGLNFKPNSVKTRNLQFKTPEEKSAFAQGLVEQIKINPDSKNIAGKARDLKGALKSVLGDKSKDVLNALDKESQSYERVSTLLRKSESKLSTQDPVNGKIGLLRELGDGILSLPLGLADWAKRAGTANAARRSANYLLNPELRMRTPIYYGIKKYLPSSVAIGSADILKGE